jgi:hypothetical protein
MNFIINLSFNKRNKQIYDFYINNNWKIKNDIKK